MLRLFADQLGHAHRQHRTGRFYVRAILDWLRTLPAEHYCEYCRRLAEDRPPTPVHSLVRRGFVFAPNPSAAALITASILAWRYFRKV